MAQSRPQPILIAGSSNKPLARKIAAQVGVGLTRVERITFSDRERHVIIRENLKGRDVYIIQPTSMPANDRIMELLLLVHAAKQWKPKRITAVMPFFGYRRQEKITVPGESLSFDLIAKMLRAAGVNRVLTVDLHKHRSSKYLTAAGITCKELRAFDTIVEYFKKKNLKNFVVLAPDKGGIPESERYAKALDVPLARVYKRRNIRKPDEVQFDRFEGEVAGKNILIIDDEINTAGTLVGVVDILKQQKAGSIYFACTHGVLSGPAVERLEQSSIRQVVITDSIYLPKSKQLKKIKMLSLAPQISQQINTWTKR